MFTDSVVPAAPPTVQITSPVNRQEFDRFDEVHLSGKVTAPAGLLRTCVTTSFTPPSFPTDCTGSVAPDGSFNNLRLPSGFGTGNNYIAVWVEDRRLRQAGASLTVVLKENDLGVTNMEVTQAVQKVLPTPAPDNHDSTHSAAYGGVPLIDDKSTAVMSWTSARLDAAGTPVHGAAVYLFCTKRMARRFQGGPIPAKEGARDIGPALSSAPAIDLPTWSNPASSWTFTLPWSWQQTGGPITLRAVVNPPTAYPRVSECASCGPNNTLRLTGIRFQRAHTLNLYPFRVFFSREGKFVAPPAEPWPVFRETIKISPFDINVHPWVGTLNAQSIFEDKSLDGDGQTSAVYDRLADAVDIAGYPGFFTLAVNRELGPGVTSAHWSWHDLTYRTYSVVEAGRPLTSVGHEIYHAIDYTHAGRSCDEAVQRGGAEFSRTLPEDRGLLESLGVDLTPLSGTRHPPAETVRLLRLRGQPDENFDLMSYCFSDEAHVWISALNWERAVGRVASATGSSVAQTAGAIRSRIATASAGGPNLGVSAEIGAGAGHILRVEPGRGRPNAPAPGSDVSFRVRDKSGQVVSDTPVVVQPTHIDLVNHGTSLVEVSAVVPAAGAASIELVESGIVLDTVRRSASAPSVKLLKPRSGLHVGSGGSLQARWRAKDRGPRPAALLGRILRGRRQALEGDRGRPARRSLPGAGLLPLAHRQRPPACQHQRRLERGVGRLGPVQRRGAAAAGDDRIAAQPHPPAGRRSTTTWTAPASTISHAPSPGVGSSGSTAATRSGTARTSRCLQLSPGERTVRLVATDRRGRSGQASVHVTVTSVKPAFLVLEAPKSVSRRARKVTIRAAASLSGSLIAGGQSFPIDPRTRKFHLPVKPGHGPLRLNLALRAGGKKTAAKLSIPRH